MTTEEMVAITVERVRERQALKTKRQVERQRAYRPKARTLYTPTLLERIFGGFDARVQRSVRLENYGRA